MTYMCFSLSLAPARSVYERTPFGGGIFFNPALGQTPTGYDGRVARADPRGRSKRAGPDGRGGRAGHYTAIPSYIAKKVSSETAILY